MTEFIWHWKKGDSKIFTRNTEFAEKAMKEGLIVICKKIKPNIVKY